MKLINGFFWPDSDRDCHPVILDQVKDIENVMQYIETYGACVQAGGNVGVWARYLAPLFRVVYTFEPNHENFQCLNANITDHNVIKFQACLGEAPDLVNVGSPHRSEDLNCGAYQVIGKGNTPVMLIDSLGLKDCSLIYLDIEGYELFALKGAEKTIKDYKPVVSLEQKKLTNNYGCEIEAASDWLIEHHDYEVVERIHRDIILAPR